MIKEELHKAILDCVDAIMEDSYELKFMMKGIRLTHGYEGKCNNLAEYIESRMDYYREQLCNIQELLEGESDDD